MKIDKSLFTLTMMIFSGILICGCGKSAPKAEVNENAPISQIKADAQKMDVEQLKTIASKYKSAIESKAEETKKLFEKIKSIPPAEMLGGEVKTLKSELDNIEKSVSKLTERLQVYLDELKAKGVDISNWEM